VIAVTVAWGWQMRADPLELLLHIATQPVPERS